jgi:hypothetical protein
MVANLVGAKNVKFVNNYLAETIDLSSNLLHCSEGNSFIRALNFSAMIWQNPEIQLDRASFPRGM